MGRVVTYRVKPSERWRNVRLFFEAYPDAMSQLCAAIPERDTSFVFDTLSVKGMLECCGGKIPAEVSAVLETKDVSGAARTLNSLHDGLMAFLRFMERTQPPMTARQKALTSGMLEGNIEEAVLWTLTSVFHLNGFEDAHKLTVYEYKTARKNAYNEALVAYKQSVAAENMAARRR